MDRRFQLSAGAIVGVAALLGFLLLWGGPTAQPVSAMEQMAESIRNAKSFKALMTTATALAPEPGKPPVIQEATGTLYWLAPGSTRTDLTGTGSLLPQPREGRSAGEQHITIISLAAGKPLAIRIDHKAKTLTKVGTPKGFHGAEMVEKLGEFFGQADRDLGTKEISGKKARGFEIGMKKLDPPPDSPASPSGPAYPTNRGTAEIWIDSESSLPLLLRFKSFIMKMDRNGTWIDFSTETSVFHDFQWNIDLDPKLFDATLPTGYTDATPKQPSAEEWIRWITRDLRSYAELTGGRYPGTLNNMLEADTAHRELLKMFGFEYPADPVPPELKRNATFQKVQGAARSCRDRLSHSIQQS